MFRILDSDSDSEKSVVEHKAVEQPRLDIMERQHAIVFEDTDKLDRRSAAVQKIIEEAKQKELNLFAIYGIFYHDLNDLEDDEKHKLKFSIRDGIKKTDQVSYIRQKLVNIIIKGFLGE